MFRIVRQPFCLLLMLAFVTHYNAFGQDNPADKQGLYPFASLTGSEIDSVDLMTGKLNLRIPLVSIPQRGGKLKLEWNLLYTSRPISDDLTWYDTTDPTQVTQHLVEMDGGNVIIGAPFSHTYFGYNNSGSIDRGDGGKIPIHALSTGSGLAGDGSGYRVDHVNTNCPGPQQVTITDPNGIKEQMPNCSNGPWYHTISDPSGNQIQGLYQAPWNGIEIAWQDSIGRTIPSPGMPGMLGGLFAGSWSGWINTTDFTGCTGPLPISVARVWEVPGVGGTTLSYKFCGAAINTQDLTFCPNPGDACYQASGPKLQSIVLPNGISAYTFEYDTAPVGSQTSAYGDLTRITLPSGGTISYEWEMRSPMGGCRDELGAVPWGIKKWRRVKKRTIDPGNGGPIAVWQYDLSWPTAYDYGVTTVTDPNMNQTVHHFGSPVGGLRCTPVERETLVYNGTATGDPVRKTVIDYLGIWDGVTDSNAATGVAPYRWTEYMDDDQVWQKERSYATKSVYVLGSVPLPSVKSEKIYAAGTGAAGGALSDTETSYFHETRTNYEDQNLVLLPEVVTRTSALASNSSLDTYNYDEQNGSPAGVFGNQTSIISQVDPSHTIVSTAIYDVHGNAKERADFRQNTTKYIYDANGLTITKIEAPTTLTAHNRWVTTDPDTGVMLSSVDENGSSATDSAHLTSYQYDSMGLITDQYDPAGGHIHRDPGGYAIPVTMTTTVTASPSPNQTKVTIYDGLARPIQSFTNVGSGKYIETDTCYDKLGRVVYQSYPFSSISTTTSRVCPGSQGVKPGDVFEYDVLGRQRKITHSDGSFRTTDYTGFTAMLIDESGHQRQLKTDVLGRVTDVYESNPDLSTNQLHTQYTYDALGNLTDVYQYGATGDTARHRQFDYDSVSRLKQAYNPETGWVCYGSTPNNAAANGSNCTPDYDGNGNLQSKTDARGAVVHYRYDALNRLFEKWSTSAGGHIVSNCYRYDQAVVSGTNLVGRLADEWTQSDRCPSDLIPTQAKTRHTVAAYDAVGRVLEEKQCVLTNCSSSLPYTFTSIYDAAGNLTSHGNGLQNLTLTNTYDEAGRLKEISSSVGDTTHPLYKVTSFASHGPVQSFDLGTNIEGSNTFDSRLRITGFQAVTK